MAKTTLMSLKNLIPFLRPEYALKANIAVTRNNTVISKVGVFSIPKTSEIPAVTSVTLIPNL